MSYILIRCPHHSNCFCTICFSTESISIYVLTSSSLILPPPLFVISLKYFISTASILLFVWFVSNHDLQLYVNNGLKTVLKTVILVLFKFLLSNELLFDHEIHFSSTFLLFMSRPYLPLSSIIAPRYLAIIFVSFVFIVIWLCCMVML